MDPILPISQLLEDALRSLPKIPNPNQTRLHRGWSTNKHLCVLLPGALHNLLQNLLGNIPLSYTIRRLKFFTRSTDRVMNIQFPRVQTLIRIELLPEKQILLGIHAEDHGDFRLVGGVVEDSLCELVNGCNACTACDQVDVV